MISIAFAIVLLLSSIVGGYDGCDTTGPAIITALAFCSIVGGIMELIVGLGSRRGNLTLAGTLLLVGGVAAIASGIGSGHGCS